MKSPGKTKLEKEVTETMIVLLAKEYIRPRPKPASELNALHEHSLLPFAKWGTNISGPFPKVIAQRKITSN